MSHGQVSGESLGVLASNFVEAYPKVDISDFAMVWNGKRGVAFDDANQSFREQVILRVLKDPMIVPMALVYQLMHEEARWASKTLTFRYYLTDLLELLLANALETYEAQVIMTFTENPYALKCVDDFKSEDVIIEKWLMSFQRAGKLNQDPKLKYEAFCEALDRVLKVRHGQRAQAESFERYVTEKDPWPIALKRRIKHLWHHGEMTWLALFFIIPLTLLLGYYFFGFAILYGLLPVFRALMVLYIIYRIAHWVVG